jgi:transcriptional regulator with XRE-family HTH domain
MTHPVDVYVGKRLRFRRTILGLAQRKLGEQIGVTHQQIQKYEKGINRMGSSTLFKLATILRVPISYFFDGYETQEEIQDIANEYGLKNKEIKKLVKNFIKIEDAETRKSVVAIVKNIVKNGGTDVNN